MGADRLSIGDAPSGEWPIVVVDAALAVRLGVAYQQEAHLAGG
jgi:hypothetical protein